MKEKNKLYNSIIFPGIAEINSNVRTIPGFFPVDLKLKQKTAESLPINITYLVKKNLGHSSNRTQVFGNYYSETNSDALIRKFQLPFSMRAWIQINGLFTNPTIYVNGTYNALGKLKIHDFYPPGIHVRDMLIIGLIKAGYAPLHGVAFASRNQGILVLGPPGIGKTLVLVQAMQQEYKYLADDLILVDSTAYTHPGFGISSIAYEIGISRQIKSNNYEKLRLKLRDISHNIPLVNFVFPPKYVDIRHFTPSIGSVDKTRVNRIFLLAKGKDGVKKLSSDEAFSIITRNNKLEFSYFGNPLLLAYSVLNPLFSLKDLMQTEEELIHKLVKSIDCFQCMAENSDRYFSLIQRNM